MGLGQTNKRVILILFLFCLIFNFAFARTDIISVNNESLLFVADASDNYALTNYTTCVGRDYADEVEQDGEGNVYVTCGDGYIIKHNYSNLSDTTEISTGRTSERGLEYDPVNDYMYSVTFENPAYFIRITPSTNAVSTYSSGRDRGFNLDVDSDGNVYTISYGNGQWARLDGSTFAVTSATGCSGVYSRIPQIDDSGTRTYVAGDSFGTKGLNVMTSFGSGCSNYNSATTPYDVIITEIGDVITTDAVVSDEGFWFYDKSNSYSSTQYLTTYRPMGVEIEYNATENINYVWAGLLTTQEYCSYNIDFSMQEEDCFNITSGGVRDSTPAIINFNFVPPQTDFDAPIVTDIVVDDIPNANGYFVSYDNAPKMYLTTDENASCRWSLTDEAYTTMDGYCVEGINTTNHVCYLNDVALYDDTVYIACNDEWDNFHTDSDNYDQIIWVNIAYTTSTQEFEDVVLQDTWIRNTTPTQNLNSENIAIYSDVRGGSGEEERWGIVEVDMDRLSLDNITKIGSVDLVLYSWLNEVDSGENVYIHAHRVYSNFTWDESTMTWNLRPLPYQDYDPTIMDTTAHNVASGTGYINWSVTSAIKDCYENQESTCTIYLTSTASATEGGDNMYFKGSEVATVSQRPKLSVKYYEPRVWNDGDTYVRSNQPTNNFGGRTSLTLVGGSSPYNIYVLINGSEVAENQYEDVNYEMYVEGTSGTGNFEITYCNDDFDENTLTYSNANTEVLNCDGSPFLSESITGLTTLAVNQFDMTDVFNNDLDKIFTLKITVSSTGDWISSYQKESNWGGFTRYPHATLGDVKILKEEQPHFIYYNNFDNGNLSLDAWVKNGWFVNAEGKAEGYNTWEFYYPDFIDTLYPEYNNVSVAKPISMEADWTILTSIPRPNCMGIFGDASVTMATSREVMCLRTGSSFTQWLTRGSTGQMGYSDSTINVGQEYKIGYYILNGETLVTYKTYRDGSQKVSSQTSAYGIDDYGDFGFYRDTGSTSASLMTLDNMKVWDGSYGSMPELLYVTPIPNITVTSPLNNSAQNTTLFNVTFSVIDEDNSSLACRVDVNETTLWSQQVNNNTVTNAEINVTPDGDYYFEVKCDDDNYNNETSGQYFFNMTTVIPCAENWTAHYGVCNTGDEQLKWYTDDNVCNTTGDLPIDNNTFVACNYCSEDLVENIAPCEFNGTDFYSITTYSDNNYFSCCAMTGIVDDCSVDYTAPYNETGYNLCNAYADDFEIQYDEQALYGLSSKEKVYWKFYINETNMTEDYECISYIKHMNNGVVGEIIQVNPVYTKKTEGFISLDDSFDDREYFRTVNGLGNVYFTKDNLIMDVRQYLYGIQCTGNGKRLVSERVVTTEYESLNAPVNLAFWGKNNMQSIFLGLAIFMFVAIGIGILVQIFRRDSR